MPKKRIDRSIQKFVGTSPFFSSIIESSADAIVASDRDKRIIYFSKGAESLFERRAEDVLGKSVLSIYTEESMRRENRRARSREMKKEGIIRNLVMEIETPKKKVKSISLTISPLKSSDGEIIGTVGIARDITKELANVRELSYLKKLNDKIFESIPEGLMLIDLQQNILTVNSGFERLTGVGKHKIIGDTVGRAKNNPKLSGLFKKMKFHEKFSRLKETEQILGPKEFSAKIDGHSKTFTDYWTPLFGRNGELEFMLIIIRDLSKRKTLEQNLREQSKVLKKSNELKDLFSDILRHDLMNPIGVMKNYIDLMSTEELTPFIEQSMDGLSRNVRKSIEMIETAARFAKIEDEAQIEVEEKNIPALLGNVVKDIGKLGEKRGITFTLKSQKSYRAPVNPFIEDVFSNLLTNAIKYGNPKTEVLIEFEGDEKGWRISVKDRGIGVPDEYKKAIFTRFERLKKEGVKGSGLGLAIVKRVVEMHKGKVWVEDNPGGGSVFRVEIPKDLKRHRHS